MDWLAHEPLTFLTVIFCGAKLYFETDIFSLSNFDIQRTVHLLKNDLKDVYYCRKLLGFLLGYSSYYRFVLTWKLVCFLIVKSCLWALALG